MPDLNDFSESLESTLKDSNLQGVGVELAEVVLDNLLSDGIAKDIPIIGSILGLGKTVVNIKDRLFLKKIIYFLSELKDIPPDTRKSMVNSIDSSGDFRIKIGEKLLFIIDRCDDHEKSKITARFFSAFILGKLDYSEFLRCASIVDQVMLEDLHWFAGTNEDDYVAEEVSELINTGIFSFLIANERDFDRKMPDKYFLRAYVSDIGKKIRDILKPHA